jgi:hypothetical protein
MVLYGLRDHTQFSSDSAHFIQYVRTSKWILLLAHYSRIFPISKQKRYVQDSILFLAHVGATHEQLTSQLFLKELHHLGYFSN